MNTCARLLFCAILLFLIASCRKHEQAITSTYTFVNNVPERVTLDMYGSEDDYNMQQHCLSRDTIDVGGKLPKTLEVLRTYWVDWHSDGYSYNNWRSLPERSVSDNPRPLPQLTIADRDDQIQILSPVRDTSRSVLLQGSQLFSKWSGVIDHADSLNGTFHFVFRKDFSGEYSFSDTAGRQIVSKPIKYTIRSAYTNMASYSPGFLMFIFDDDSSSIFCQVISHPAGPFNSGCDSMTLSYSRWPFMQLWPLVRIK